MHINISQDPNLNLPSANLTKSSENKFTYTLKLNNLQAEM